MSLWLILILTVLTCLNIIAPYSGTVVITPILVGITGDPQKAITLGLFYFVMSSVVRTIVFRKNIQWHYVKMLVPVSTAAALLGALLSIQIPTIVVLIIMIYATSVYLYKKIINKKQVKKENKFSVYSVGLFTGFLQGTGIVGGSDMRNNYFFSRGLTIAEVGATTGIVGILNFVAAIGVRSFQGMVTIPEIAPLLILLPFTIVGTVAGKYLLLKINKRTQDIIIYFVISMALCFLIYRLLSSIL